MPTPTYGEPGGRNQTTHSAVVTIGMYIDELRKVDGQWLISQRTFRYDGYPDLRARVGKPVDVSKPFAV
ncbi:hypothetical protein [Amycolatopsis camponoti]|uniref:hypothetical protein n=1 Tax=Amycolatopsis camponoti TaxID=2606593 RepID=UPI0012D80035|nr:hypothetical protein [Amycolatopsis camponoti]